MMLIRNQYPNGFCDSDLVAMKKSDGSYFDALEVRTNDSIYLVKVNHDLLQKIDDFEEKYDGSAELEMDS